MTLQRLAGHPTQADINAHDLPIAPRSSPIPGGWVGRRHPSVSCASSTPADLLSAFPGQSNLFLPVVPGPRLTPQTPTGEEGQGAGPASCVPPPCAADDPARCPAWGSPWTPPHHWHPPAVPGGTWQPAPLSPPQCKGRRAERRGGAPHPAPCWGPLHPHGTREPAAGQRTQGNSLL